MKKTHEIHGWFSEEDKHAYLYLIENISSSENPIFVECGAWLGLSSSFLCDNTKDTNIKIFIIDTWMGSESELDTYHSMVKTHDIYKEFIENMGDRRFTAIRKESKEASEQFEDNSCDVVFIDMDHTYEAVSRDIRLWLPKVKKGGYLSGHDYQDERVRRAVHEILGNDILVIGGSWIYKIILN